MKLSSKRDLTYSRKYAIIAFLVVFIIQILFNTMVICMRSLPDEMGAVALAASMAGYDWNYVLTHPSMYYGSGTALLLYPFFALVKNPIILYQCLLGVGALLHAFPAYIACRIIQKYYMITENKACIIAIGVISAFFTPTRASNIDNEPMLILLCWIIVYIIIVLIHTESKKVRSIYSVVWATVLAVSYFSHTRALIYALASVIVILAYVIITRKKIVNLICFCVTYFVEMLVVNALVVNIKTTLFTSDITETVKNTPEEVVGNAVSNIQSLVSVEGIHAFVDLLLSNIWIIFVFSGGVVIFCVCIFFVRLYDILKKIKKGKIQLKDEIIFFPMMFCLIGILVSLIGLCIIWLPNAMTVHSENANLSRGHFYLRYYGNYFGPLILFFIIALEKRRTDKYIKRLGSVSIIIVVVASLYSVVSFLGMATIYYKYDLDWFYYFAPFSGMLNSWPNTIQTLSYFACSTLVAIAIFLSLIYFVLKRKLKLYLLILIGVFIWQYGYGVSRFDAPFSNSLNYYQSVDSFYKFYNENNFILKDIDEMYYYNETYGPAYIVQFMIPDKKIITDLELMEGKIDVVLLSNVKLDNNKLKEMKFKYVQLDENEYLYLNNSSTIKKIKEQGYNLQEN